MKDRILKTIVFGLFLLLASSVYAKTEDVSFHAILAVDIFAEDIQWSTIQDLAHVKKSVYSIAHQLGLKPDIQVIKAADCSVHNIKKALRSVVGYKDDIIMFYYSGHGNKDPQNHPWPVMYPSQSVYGRGLLGASVVKYFKHHPHRLALVWMDCCNKHISPGPYASITKEPLVIGQNEHLPGLRHLFLESRGLVVGSGANHGEASIGLTDGGVFTNALLSGLKIKCNNESVTWGDIFSYVSSYCPEHAQPDPQHPIMQYFP